MNKLFAILFLGSIFQCNDPVLESDILGTYIAESNRAVETLILENSGVSKHFGVLPDGKELSAIGRWRSWPGDNNTQGIEIDNFLYTCDRKKSDVMNLKPARKDSVLERSFKGKLLMYYCADNAPDYFEKVNAPIMPQ